MRVAVIGAGSREQAIAWACGRHGHDVALVADVAAIDPAATDLVIPGPEAALVAGAADRCAELGVPCFGPPAALARLEASKGFARELATSLGIPARATPGSPPVTSTARSPGGARSADPSSSSSTAWPPGRA
jgi:phosphoribosylamine-glycine ligase